MEDELIHELSAAHALRLLDDQEQRFYTRHLAHCQRCQAEVASFGTTVAALAYAAPPVDLPPALRGRILNATRAESTWVQRRRFRAAATATAALSAVFASLAIWAAASHTHHPSTRQTLALHGAKGNVIRASDGNATLIVSGLHAAPNGHTYEAWILHNGTAVPAGTFPAATDTTVIHLTTRIPRGAIVAVTIENGTGANATNTATSLYLCRGLTPRRI